jgi:two-component system, chemotaxis family, response regulator Rcp1
MLFDSLIYETCPRCHKPVTLAGVEPHSSRRDIALHNFKCADCGYVKTKVVALKPGEAPPEQAASASRDFNRAISPKGQSMVRSLFINRNTPMIILLVEDNPGDARLTLETLGDANPSVRLYVATDGSDAMAFLRREGHHTQAPRPELILLDINMPKMNGCEVLASIKSDDSLKLIPTIMLTTSAAEDDFVDSYRLQANCFLRKPVQMDALDRVVERINDFWMANARLPQLALVA